MNNLYQRLVGGQNSGMLNLFRNARNPQALLQSMAQTNPKLRPVMDMLNRNGGDAQKAFYELAKQTGVNPDEFLQMIR